MNMMKWRWTLVLTSIVLGLFLLFWSGAAPSIPSSLTVEEVGAAGSQSFDGVWDYGKHQNNLMLNTAQCERAFPGLFDEIERPKRDRQNQHFTLEELNSIVPRNGYVRAMIYDQQV
jgi:hypothetical protein